MLKPKILSGILYQISKTGYLSITCLSSLQQGFPYLILLYRNSYIFEQGSAMLYLIRILLLVYPQTKCRYSYIFFTVISCRVFSKQSYLFVFKRSTESFIYSMMLIRQIFSEEMMFLTSVLIKISSASIFIFLYSVTRSLLQFSQSSISGKQMLSKGFASQLQSHSKTRWNDFYPEMLSSFLLNYSTSLESEIKLFFANQMISFGYFDYTTFGFENKILQMSMQSKQFRQQVRVIIYCFISEARPSSTTSTNLFYIYKAFELSLRKKKKSKSGLIQLLGYSSIDKLLNGDNDKTYFVLIFYQISAVLSSILQSKMIFGFSALSLSFKLERLVTLFLLFLLASFMSNLLLFKTLLVRLFVIFKRSWFC